MNEAAKALGMKDCEPIEGYVPDYSDTRGCGERRGDMSITVAREGSGERKQDEYTNELWSKIREKERRIVELEAELAEARSINIHHELAIENQKLREALEQECAIGVNVIRGYEDRIKALEAELAEAKRSEEIYESIVEGVEAVMSDIEPEIVHLPEAVKKLRQAIQNTLDTGMDRYIREALKGE